MITMQCTKCFIEYGMPDEMCRQAKQQGRAFTFYCTAGRPQSFGEGEIEKERRLRQTAEQQNARWSEEARIAEQGRLRAVGELKRHKRRAAAGTCPCCNRTFDNMSRHMKSKHPDYNVVPLKAAKA